MLNSLFSSISIYAWSGFLNANLQHGYLAASSKKSVISKLKQQQIIIISIKRANRLSTSYYKQKGILLFFEQLSPLLEIGIPLLSSLELIEEQLSPVWQRLIYLIKIDINQGESLSYALNNYSTLFPKIYIYFIKIGEISGSFTECLRYLIQYQQQRIEQQQKLKQALRYPLFILSSSIILLIIVLLFILPEMENIYLLSNTTLPFSTQLLLKINHQSSTVLPWLSSLIILSFISYRSARLKSQALQHCEHILLNKTPYIKMVYRYIFLCNFFHALYLLHRVGIPLLKSLDTISESLMINQYKPLLQSIKNMLLTGHHLHYCLKQYPEIFSNLCYQLVYIGEESGNLEEMFLKLYQYYHNEITQQTTKISNLVGPLTTIIIALFIGFIVFAIYTPLFQLGDVLR